MNVDLSAVHHSNARRLNEMKIFLLLLLLFVRGPLLCEKNSLLGYRLDWNNSKGNVSLKHLERSRKRKVFTEYLSDSHQGDWWFLEIHPSLKFIFLTKELRYCVRSF